MDRTARIACGALVLTLLCSTLSYAGEKASISLLKTAGLDPITCGSQQKITISKAGPVAYCYTVTNTGEVTFTVHSLVDNVLGTILSNEPFDLAPGESASIIRSHDVTADVTNVATYTAGFDDALSTGPAAPDIVTVTATSTATVKILPPAGAPVLSPASLAFVALALVLIGGAQVSWRHRKRT